MFLGVNCTYGCSKLGFNNLSGEGCEVRVGLNYRKLKVFRKHNLPCSSSVTDKKYYILFIAFLLCDRVIVTKTQMPTAGARVRVESVSHCPWKTSQALVGRWPVSASTELRPSLVTPSLGECMVGEGRPGGGMVRYGSEGCFVVWYGKV